MRLRITKHFSFEMAHALDGYNGPCANLHGHSYHLAVTVEVSQTDNLDSSGIAFDFRRLKEIVQRQVIDMYDHALVLHDRSQYASALQPPPPNLRLLPFVPSTEQLLVHFASLIQPHLPPEVHLHSLRLSETDSSEAELLL